MPTGGRSRKLGNDLGGAKLPVYEIIPGRIYYNIYQVLGSDPNYNARSAADVDLYEKVSRDLKTAERHWKTILGANKRWKLKKRAEELLPGIRVQLQQLFSGHDRGHCDDQEGSQGFYADDDSHEDDAACNSDWDEEAEYYSDTAVEGDDAEASQVCEDENGGWRQFMAEEEVNKWRQVRNISCYELYGQNSSSAPCSPYYVLQFDASTGPTSTRVGDESMVQRNDQPRVATTEPNAVRFLVVNPNGECEAADTDAEAEALEARFRTLDWLTEGRTDTRSYRRLRFSELFRDFVIDAAIPRIRAEAFIRTCKREDCEWDLHKMPTTWRALAKIPRGIPNSDTSKKAKNLVTRSVVGGIDVVTVGETSDATGGDGATGLAAFNARDVVKKYENLTCGPPEILRYTKEVNDKKQTVARYVDFGLIRRIKKVLDVVLDVTFPDGDRPDVPQLMLELWTDGLQPFNSGVENNVWPNCVTILAIGETGTNEFRFVPPRARKPITIGMYFGGRKPYHPELLLREIVNELILLDPCERQDRDNVLAAMIQRDFTARLSRLLADTLARAIAKHIPSHGSTFFCEQCCCQSYKITSKTGRIIYVFEVAMMTMRTDDKFLEYEEHGMRVSILQVVIEIFVCGSLPSSSFVSTWRSVLVAQGLTLLERTAFACNSSCL